MSDRCDQCGYELKHNKCKYCGYERKRFAGTRRGRSSKKDKFPNKDVRERSW